MSLKSLMHSAAHATRARHALLTAIGVTALSLIAVNVQAQTVAKQTTVSLKGLNLAKIDDAKAAYSKLRTAARYVCEQPTRDPRVVQRRQQCFDEALSNAVASVGSGNLSALHDSDRNVRLAQRSGSGRS